MSNAYEMPFKGVTMVPSEDLTKAQYCFVELTNDGTGKKCEAGKAALGILQEPCGINEPANVMVSGISFCLCEGAVNAGDEVEVGTDGKCKTLASGKKVGYCVVSGADGAYCSILVK